MIECRDSTNKENTGWEKTAAINHEHRHRSQKVFPISISMECCLICFMKCGLQIKKRNGKEKWCSKWGTRLIKINGVDRITNKEVLNHVYEKRTIWSTRIKRRDIIIAHILRHGDHRWRNSKENSVTCKLKYACIE